MVIKRWPVLQELLEGLNRCIDQNRGGEKCIPFRPNELHLLQKTLI